MFAGASPKNSAVNNDPQLVRFMAGANGIYYVYVADPVTSYWSHSPAYKEAVANFTAVFNGNGNPSKPQGPVISFPFGTIEVKAAFRELTNAEKASGRFFQTRVRYYEQDDADPNDACYHEAVWGMVGLHIIHKTKTAPTFIFFTFEQADNLLNTDGKPVENEDGKIINPSPSGTSTTPAQVYMDGDPPSLKIVGDKFCENIGKRLYYMEEKPFGGIPTGGSICVNERDRAIPPAVVDVNRVAHKAIERYNAKNGLEDSPWLYYKLVNVQWRPFDFSEIDEDNSDGINNPATYYLNNIMVETDFSLQNLATRLYKDMGADGPGGGVPTVMPPNFDVFDPTRQTRQNTLTFDEEGNLKKTYGMGGCMGCHGNDAQSSGNNWSFILRFGRVVNGPEATSVTSPGATNPINQ